MNWLIQYLTISLLGNFHAFVVAADFFQFHFFKNSFENTIRVYIYIYIIGFFD